jgi:hypothetical protein
MNWPIDRDLPEGRHRLLKEFVMTEIAAKTPRKSLRRPAVLVPVLGLAAAAAVAVPLLFGGAPAYAITHNQDGTVDIAINEARDPGKLQADLRAMGMNVTVDYIPDGKKCSPQPRASHFLTKEEAPLSVSRRRWAGFTIDPSVIKKGQTGVLEFSIGTVTGPGPKGAPGPELPAGRTATVAALWARVADGPVAACTLVNSTDAPLSH